MKVQLGCFSECMEPIDMTSVSIPSALSKVLTTFIQGEYVLTEIINGTVYRYENYGTNLFMEFHT